MRNLIAILGGLALVGIGAGCGSDGPSCGNGTVEVDGECVPSGDPVTCATGTVLMGTECVPDGSVICETGTTYDANTGTCVPDITGCAEGTVLVSGECVPYDETLTGDIQEPAEPNGPEVGSTALLFDLPAEGDDVVISGCIEPRPDYNLDGNVDADLDFYVMQTTAPALIDVTVDGVGGMAGGFNLVPLDGELSADSWGRLGISLVEDTVQRQIYLPKAGQYLLAIADSRSLFLGQGNGDGTTTCYFATVAHLATPSGTAISGTQATGTMSQDAQFFSFSPADGDRLDTTFNMETVSDAIGGSIVTLVDGVYMGSAETSSPAVDSLAGLSASSTVTYVIESTINVQLTPVDFTLDLAVTGAAAAGAADTVNSLTVANDTGSSFYIDVANAGDVVNFVFDSTTAAENFNVSLVDMRGDTIGSLVSNAQTSDIWAAFPTAGRYTLTFENGTTGTGTTDVDLTYSVVTPGTLTYGTPVTGGSLDANGLAFYWMTASGAVWMDAILAATDFGGNGLLHFTGESIFDLGSPVGADAQQIVGGADVSVLVVVEDDDFANASGTPSFDLDIGEQDFTNSMTVDEANPVNLTGVTLGADTSLYYYFQVGWDAEFTATVQGTEDLVLRRLNASAQGADIDENGAGGAETFSSGTVAPTWVAFEVLEFDGNADTITVDVEVTDPTYGMTLSDVNLNSTCIDGETVELGPDGLSDVITIGFDFPFFGVTQTELLIAENGWLTFDTAFAGTGGHEEWLGDSIAVYDTDFLYAAEDICIVKQSDHVEILWRLDEFDFTGLAHRDVQAQVILWDDGKIDYRFGPGSSFAFSTNVNTLAVNSDGSDFFDRSFIHNPSFDRRNLSMLMTPK